MQCKRIQELLKSDYLDGELSQSENEYIKEHLKLCADCSKVEKELEVQRLFFQQSKPQPVPERVWHNIREAINAKTRESRVSLGIFERLKKLIFAPRPAFALASAFAVLILIAAFAGVIIHNRQSLSKENYGESVLGYRLNGESGDLLYDLGTDIEEYFL